MPVILFKLVFTLYVHFCQDSSITELYVKITEETLAGLKISGTNKYALAFLIFTN